MTFNFKIGNMTVSIHSPIELPWTDNMKKFYSPDLTEDEIKMHYHIKPVSNFQPIYGEVLFSDESMIVMKVDNSEVRIFLLATNKEPYGLAYEVSNNEVNILVDSNILPFLKLDTTLFNFLLLEKYLLKLLPKDYLGSVNHLFVWHGRNTCIARKPKCESCTIKNYCESYNKTKHS